ncbi:MULTISPECIES: hypothetical protein [unclassified Streptomyces]|uniref:hypothetical protein n=1 Tax=unclassified Streptomyces TaxID=2593676 RepID=UPI00074B0092|nr:MULTISPECIES: hypothetical protein [unclassified Streptomyces]KUL70941.1 hypothetical protein ADL34_25830 [Streptomyces sp. NRRL WC-3605]KUL72844.1 hypothetical protein ADL33_21985 [Streptomyces sp. NRRL WC-3604]
MSDQPYQGYDGYDRYRQEQPPHGWPQQQPYDDPQAAQQYTQQWQGQTWETQVQPPVAPAAEETAYMPSQGAGAVYGGHQAPAAGYQEAGWGGTGHPQAPAQPQAPAHPQAPVHARTPAPAQAAAQTPPAGAAEPGYGPATVAGNARVTDAQRARLEGRSPIIEPGLQPAGLTALLGLLLAGAAAIGPYALVVPLVALQAVTAAGWFRLNGMWPARQGIALAFAGGLTADVALLVSGRTPAAILGTLGVWVLLALVLQLRSHADPDERMYGLMATVASAALAIVASGYLSAHGDAVSVGAAAVAVAVLVRALPLPTPASVAASLLAAAGAGALAGALTGMGASGALLGAGAAVCALIGHRVASYDYPSRFVHFTAGVALPLAAAAPAVYLLGRALV